MHHLHDHLHGWLLRLTRPEDQLLWIWLAIAAGYGVVGAMLGGVHRVIWTRLRQPGVRRSSR